jgi:hypothetical protein
VTRTEGRGTPAGRAGVLPLPRVTRPSIMPGLLAGATLLQGSLPSRNRSGRLLLLDETAHRRDGRVVEGAPLLRV